MRRCRRWGLKRDYSIINILFFYLSNERDSWRNSVNFRLRRVVDWGWNSQEENRLSWAWTSEEGWTMWWLQTHHTGSAWGLQTSFSQKQRNPNAPFKGSNSRICSATLQITCRNIRPEWMKRWAGLSRFMVDRYCWSLADITYNQYRNGFQKQNSSI